MRSVVLVFVSLSIIFTTASNYSAPCVFAFGDSLTTYPPSGHNWPYFLQLKYSAHVLNPVVNAAVGGARDSFVAMS